MAREKAIDLKVDDSKSAVKCPICSESHQVYRCAQFHVKSPAERLVIAGDNNLCRNCLSKDLQSLLSLDYEDSITVKILGSHWCVITDNFKYQYLPRSNHSTKHSILSDIARIYDPLGFLAPRTFKAKHFIQQLWQVHCDWDDIPPHHVVTQWENFKQQLTLLSNLEIPRFMSSSDYKTCELHLFCDASEVGYATAAYLRYQNQDELIKTYFIGGKSRIAPLKTISIPRLELCGAIDFLLIIKNTIASVITIDSITAWSDSQVVLSWIKSSPHKWKWNGPEWLSQQYNNWPNQQLNKSDKEVNKEKRAIINCTTDVSTNILDELLNKFSQIYYRQLAPFMDRDGLLRVDGRLRCAEIPFEHKHQLLLPKNCPLTQLIIEETHHKFIHPGLRTLSSLTGVKLSINPSHKLITP
ncbi:uncharacterized protein [Onthophagus taurus]|uniref:uncharacterized protein n=1 Tax=Onthophagus taurus TaxID=166361 RepID=UPI0039BDCE87